MELALLYFLLPVAAVSGWWLGFRYSSTRSPKTTDQLSSDYFTGLNFLLNEQPDKAIDVFIKMLEINSDTVETYLALGNLFRRRGESDRAIRIHQSLIARPTLSKEQRCQALFELGKDFMRAGILGRAENLFLELVDDRSHRVPALKNLLDIYQQERDWDKCMTTARKIESSSGYRMGTEIAQYCCELALIAQNNRDERSAIKLLKRALSNDHNCVRANILLGNIEKHNENFKAAIRSYRQVENQDPAYITEILEPLVECYQAISKIDEMAEYLNQVLNRYEGLTPVVAQSGVIGLQRDELAAEEHILHSLEKTPTIRGLNQWIKLKVAKSDGHLHEQLAILQAITSRMVEDHPVYKCTNCGFSGKRLYWQCPTCRQWCTVKPIQADEKD